MISNTALRFQIIFTACVFGALFVPWSAVYARRAIHEHLLVDPQSSIEITNVAGSVDLSGWDRPEIDVTGTAGDQVERIDVTNSGTHSTVRVVARSGSSWGDANEARLTIHVPRKSAVTANLVSADLTLKDLQGDLALQTVSGNVSGDVGANLHATSVSGNVRVRAPAADMLEIKTISGDITLSGGGGEVEVTTISGDAHMDFSSIKRGRFKSVSGDLTVGLALAVDGQLHGESVSGNVRIDFAHAPTANFDMQSFSGDIRSCFGPKPVESTYGPGSRLSFKNGESNARVQIETKSGDVHLCAKDLHGERPAMQEMPQTSRPTAHLSAALYAGPSRRRFLP